MLVSHPHARASGAVRPYGAVSVTHPQRAVQVLLQLVHLVLLVLGQRLVQHVGRGSHLTRGTCDTGGRGQQAKLGTGGMNHDVQREEGHSVAMEAAQDEYRKSRWQAQHCCSCVPGAIMPQYQKHTTISHVLRCYQAQGHGRTGLMAECPEAVSPVRPCPAPGGHNLTVLAEKYDDTQPTWYGSSFQMLSSRIRLAPSYSTISEPSGLRDTPLTVASTPTRGMPPTCPSAISAGGATSGLKRWPNLVPSMVRPGAFSARSWNSCRKRGSNTAAGSMRRRVWRLSAW